MRIYVLRFAIITLLAWFAVRLLLKPLNRLAEAAQQLGRNIHSKPLATDGPLEVSQAAHAFNAMQRRLVDNLAERSRFLAAVSHDLRSPITRMKLRTELLDSDPLRQKFRHDLEEMDALIAATLDLMQDVDPGEGRQLIDINSLLASQQSDAAETNGVVSIHGRARPLLGYPRSLKRCLQNLIENAIRYGKRADIEVFDSAERLDIHISDDGPGIPPDLLEQVLEPYYRLEQSRNSSTGGFGLGLSIAHTVVQAHQGSLTLSKRTPHGLRVSVLLPYTPSASVA
jgi:signal transduction histidine kinase